MDKKRNTISLSTKKLIVEHSINGKFNKEISDYLNISQFSISRILCQWRKSGDIESKPRGGDYSSKLINLHKQYVLGLVDDNPLLTLSNLKDMLFSEYRINISPSTINRCLKDFLYTVKRIVKIPARRNIDTIIELRKKYADNFQCLQIEIEDKSIIFLDEVGFG